MALTSLLLAFTGVSLPGAGDLRHGGQRRSEGGQGGHLRRGAGGGRHHRRRVGDRAGRGGDCSGAPSAPSGRWRCSPACAYPFLQLGAQYLLYKLTAFLAGAVGAPGLCRLIDGLGGAFGLILGMTGSCAVLLLVSILASVGAVMP